MKRQIKHAHNGRISAPVGGVLKSFIGFSGIFAITQVPLAIIEGLVIGLLIAFLPGMMGLTPEWGGADAAAANKIGEMRDRGYRCVFRRNCGIGYEKRYSVHHQSGC